MLEVEIKAALGDKTPALIEGIAERNGFVRAEMLREIDVYFNGNDRNFMKTDEALRLRSCEKLGENTGETLITYKAEDGHGFQYADRVRNAGRRFGDYAESVGFTGLSGRVYCGKD